MGITLSLNDKGGNEEDIESHASEGCTCRPSKSQRGESHCLQKRSENRLVRKVVGKCEDRGRNVPGKFNWTDHLVR